MGVFCCVHSIKSKIMRLTIALLPAIPAAAVAEQPLPKPDVVIIPRVAVQAAMNWIATPDPTNAVRLYSALQACLQDNPIDGRVSRMGPDQCPEVTEAIAARDKEIADLRQLNGKTKEPPK